MSWLSNQPESPIVLEGSPADAVPGDELVWASEQPGGPLHHAVEVGLVLHDPHQGRVRVLSRDGTELEFATDRVVILLRGLQGMLERSRATTPENPADRDRAAQTDRVESVRADARSLP